MLKHFANLVYFEQIFYLLFSVGKKKKLDTFFFFATISALNSDPKLKCFLLGLKAV